MAKTVELQTSKGNIVVELNEEKAPITTENFLSYVEDGFFEGTIFHRVIKGFMVQGGGLTEDLREKHAKAPIVNEADNGLANERGTIAMARTSDPNSATSQFFINHADNEFLNFQNKTNPGYAVFGRVVDGMDVVDAIADVPTGRHGMYDDVPKATITILKAHVVE